jgi:signal transduction histidine kinase
MHTLPSLNNSLGTWRLPLADPTAEFLTDALLGNAPERRRELFRAALRGDPAFAVWGLAQAYAHQHDDLRSVSALADWLAEQPPPFFRPERSHGEADEDCASLDDFVEPAGCSLAVAELSAELAAATGADEEQSYFLGLVHLGPAWLAEASSSTPTLAADHLLPGWLAEETRQARSPYSGQSPRAACLAQAIALYDSNLADEWRAMGCDARHWMGRWEILGKNWGRTGIWAERLQLLIERLAAHESLQAEFERALETAKLEAMKELAYGAGHEINNPLANISARAQTLLRAETDPERRRALAAINTQAFRAHEMIADMMLFARPPQPRLAACDAGSILKTLVSELTATAEELDVRLQLDLPEDSVSILADHTQIAAAVRCLLVNSLEALPTGGEITIALRDAAAQSPWITISVTDNGPGIPAEIRAKIFDPFFSGREAGRGLGLGLSKAWRLITQHGGRIELESRPQTGASFTILLPNSP